MKRIMGVFFQQLQEGLGIIFGSAEEMRGSFHSPVWNCGALRPRSIPSKVTSTKRLVDSITANSPEGLGRHFKESKNFAYYSRGPLFETKTWVAKASKRGLVSEGQSVELQTSLESLGRMINRYINSIGSKPNAQAPNALMPNTQSPKKS